MRKTRVLVHNQKMLALNLDWIPLLGDTSKVKQQAKRLKASHSIISGKPAAALGLAYGIKIKNILSIAELFANYYPKGSYACVFAIDPESWHVLACHEGVVMVHADRTYISQEQALTSIDQLLLSYPNLELIKIGDRQSFFNKLLEKNTQVAQLSKLQYGYGKYLLLILLFASSLIWHFWPQNKTAFAQAKSVQSSNAWADSIDKVLSENRIHGVMGTKELLKIIRAQPLFIAGWQMSSIQCMPSALSEKWLCHGEYKRKDLNADNKGFIRQAPNNWQMDFPSLDLIRSNWTIKLPNRVIKPSLLPKSKIIESDWASELQYILPAFTSLRLAESKAVKIPIPKAEDGTDLPVPIDFPNLANRKLTISGPLRSASLLKGIADAIAWQKVFIRYAPGVKANIKASSLTIQLEGYVYENRS